MGPTWSSDPNSVTLRRPLLARLLGTTFQLVLTSITAALVAITAIGLRDGLVIDWYTLLSLLFLAVPVALWLRSLTAWARVDNEGLHWRYWIRWDRPWSDITGVTLKRVTLLLSTSPYSTTGPPVIEIHTQNDIAGNTTENIRPAMGCGRHRREFATAILNAARARGIRIDVASNDWDEEPHQMTTDPD